MSFGPDGRLARIPRGSAHSGGAGAALSGKAPRRLCRAARAVYTWTDPPGQGSYRGRRHRHSLSGGETCTAAKTAF